MRWKDEVTQKSVAVDLSSKSNNMEQVLFPEPRAQNKYNSNQLRNVI